MSGTHSSKPADWFDGFRQGLGETGSPVAPAPTPDLDPRYEVMEKLGEGASSTVFRARDRQLDRLVALKVLKEEISDWPQVQTRFTREAQILARLSHPNLVTLYDAGTSNGRLYLVLEYVAGRPLSEVLGGGRQDLRKSVEQLEKVARALGAAHRLGIVHRDVKPSNILIGPSGEPKLSDFGLALLPGRTTAITRSGAALGTPAYMAPEQVEGHRGTVGPRTDVYGLGAVLYEVLAGRPPHLGENLNELYHRILDSELAPIRKGDPQVPRELEAIAFRALDKEANRRYPTAEAFAADLGRWLRSEPVAAKRSSWAYRLYRRVKRNPVVSGSAAAALLAMLITVTVWTVSAGREARLRNERELESAKLAEERKAALEMMRSTARMSLEAALQLRRAGLNEGMKKFLPELEAAYRKSVERAPDLPEVDYLMGRMHRALMDDAKALEFQERALRKDPRFGPSLYERVLLVARLHRRRIDELVELALREEGARMAREGGGEVRPGMPSQVSSIVERAKSDGRLQEFHARINGDLRRLESGVHGLAAGEFRCATGWMVWAQGKYDEARTAFATAATQNPYLDEAYESMSALEWSLGRYEHAIAPLEQGRKIDRGYIPFVERAALARSILGRSTAARGEDPEALYAAAIESYGEVLKLDRGRIEAWTKRGAVRAILWHYKLGRGEEQDELLTAGIEDLGEALKLNPGHDEAWMRRGAMHGSRGSYRMRRGEEPGDHLAAAIKDCNESLRLNPRRDETWIVRGGALGIWGDYKEGRGEDPRALYAAAIDDYGEALKCNPGWAATWLSRGIVRMNWGRFISHRGEDPGALYEAAIGDYVEALRLDPGGDEPWVRRAAARVNWGAYKASRGEDPDGLYRAAIEDCGEALQRNPRRDETWIKRGGARMNLGNHKIVRGEDPGVFYGAAIEDFGEALKLNSGRDETWMARGMARMNSGNHRMDRGGDPGALYTAAIEDFDRAGSINRANAATWKSRGKLYSNWAGYKDRRGEPAGAEYRAALAAFEEAMRLNPSLEREVRAPTDVCRRYLAAHPGQ